MGADVKKEKLKAKKKAYKVYEKLGGEEEQCKGKIASCETRDVRARQVREGERERREGREGGREGGRRE